MGGTSEIRDPLAPDSELDELWRLLAAGARGAEGMRAGDAFVLRITKESSVGWSLRACITDAAGAPLPLGAAFVDHSAPPSQATPNAETFVRLLVEHARRSAKRNLDALRMALSSGTP